MGKVNGRSSDMLGWPMKATPAVIGSTLNILAKLRPHLSLLLHRLSPAVSLSTRSFMTRRCAYLLFRSPSPPSGGCAS